MNTQLDIAQVSPHAVHLRLVGPRAFELQAPCEWLEHNITLLYRGIPVHAALPHSGNCRAMLSELAGEIVYDGCVDPPVVKSLPLLELALATLPVSALAPTPAFNLDDHFQLINALVQAASQVPEPAAHALEVGSFAGHSLLLQAAALQKLGLNRSQVHSVEMAATYGMPETMKHVAQQGLNARWHHTTVGQMPKWERPLRLFFEDSKHQWQITHESFEHFESHVVEGGLIVMHDVGCCTFEYKNNVKYLSTRVFKRNETYREIKAETPSWEWLNSTTNKKAFDTLRNALIQSADKRKYERPLILESEKRPPKPCAVICHHSQSNYFYKKLRNGYAWSTCMNTRVFQRREKQVTPFILRFVTQSSREAGGGGANNQTVVDVDACKILQRHKGGDRSNKKTEI